ncbi:MAG: hypothetical protein AB7L92_02980 [Alphaproteobacteria bacterium]
MLLSKRFEVFLLFQAAILIVLYSIFIIGDYKTYYVWQQVNNMAGYNPLTHLHHPHGLRYLIASPAIFLSDHLGWERDKVFGLFVTLNMTLCAIISALVQATVSQNIEKRWSVWLLLFIPIFLTLSFPMNGRLSYMLLGTALMMLSYIRWSQHIIHTAPVWKVLPYVVLYSISLTLLSVSSGCLTVGMIVALAYTIIFLILPDKLSHRVLYGALNLIAPAALAYLQYRLIQKNLGYYDGSVFAMLTHGPGRYLSILNPNKYLIGAGMGLIVFLLLYYIRHIRFIITRTAIFIAPVLLVAVSAIIGLFGYSAMLTGSIAAMILTLHIIGTIFYARISPYSQIRQYVKENIPHLSHSRSLLATSLLCAFATGVGASQVFPDDWTVYSRSEVEKSLYNRMIYERDGKRVVSLMGGHNFFPTIMTTGRDGTMYVVEAGTRIIRITSSGQVDWFAGYARKGRRDNAKQDKDGPRMDARFHNISDIKIADDGTLYVADGGNGKIKKIDAAGMVTTIAGSGNPGAFVNGCKALECRLNEPQGLQLLPNGELLVSDNIYIIRLLHDGTMRSFISLLQDDKRVSVDNEE